MDKGDASVCDPGQRQTATESDAHYSLSATPFAIFQLIVGGVVIQSANPNITYVVNSNAYGCYQVHHASTG